MAATITVDELMAELERLGALTHQNAEGHTASEYAEQWNVSEKTARLRIRQAIDAKLMVCGRRTETRIDGRMGHVPVYRLTGAAKKPGRKRKA